MMTNISMQHHTVHCATTMIIILYKTAFNTRKAGETWENSKRPTLTTKKRCSFPCGSTSTASEQVEMAAAVQEWKTANRRRNLEETVHQISVHFHVFQPSEGVGALSGENLAAFIRELNLGFETTPFRFVMASQQHIMNPEFARCDSETSFKNNYHKGERTSMNVYFCDAYSKGEGGHARMPPVVAKSETRKLDGIVIMNPALPRAAHYIIQQSQIHEAGHFLGLLHTFEVSEVVKVLEVKRTFFFR